MIEVKFHEDEMEILKIIFEVADLNQKWKYKDFCDEHGFDMVYVENLFKKLGIELCEESEVKNDEEPKDLSKHFAEWMIETYGEDVWEKYLNNFEDFGKTFHRKEEQIDLEAWLKTHDARDYVYLAFSWGLYQKIPSCWSSIDYAWKSHLKEMK